MLNRHAVAEATRHALHAEAVHAATAPGLCGKDGIPVFRDFLARMSALITPPDQADPTALHAAEIAAFERIEARAAQS